MAMTQLNNNDVTSIETGKDSIVIVDNGYSIRGGRSLNVVGYAPRVIRAGHVIIHETATNEYKPMPVTEGNTSGVATFGTVTAGTGYTNGTYENVPLYNISGSNTGTGALATVVVAGGVVTTVTKTNGGNYYAAADVLGVNPAYVGGTGSGFSIPVATVSDVAGAYGALPAGHTYAGIQIQSVLKEKAMVGILIHGVVNPAAAPYSMTSILSAVKTALPLIIFRED